jgi:SAM-dependent methyltransferase
VALADIVALYDRSAPSYQRWWAPVIAPAAVHLLDLIAPRVADCPDATIVDVGAGTGTVSREAVARWPRVRVVAVDPSDGMLTVGRNEAAASLDRSARRRIRWQVGIAEDLPLAAGSADAVVSSFTWQYLPCPAAGLREARRLLRPGGVLAVVTWLANDRPFRPWAAFAEATRELGVVRPPSPEPFGGPFRSLRSAAALVRGAGFRGVHATGFDVEYRWARDDLVRCTLESEERELIESLDPATRDRVERLWKERLDALDDADLRYRDRVAYVTGQA